MPQGTRRIRFTVHGLTADNGFVRADIFAEKLAAFAAAAKAEDIRLNGKSAFGLMIKELKIGSADAYLDPKQLKKAVAVSDPIPDLAKIATSIQVGGMSFSAESVKALKKLVTTADGADKTHSHVEVDFGHGDVVRFDSFFRDRAVRAVEIASGDDMPPTKFFEGASVGQFDGTIKAIDSRGAIVKGKIVLTIDGSELDCVFRRDDIDSVLAEYEHRSRIEGIAIYDGTQAQPVRVNVRRVMPLSGNGLLRWAGKLKRGESSWVAAE
jgi:hypothetical protein